MAPSQLKQLKASLHEHGVLGPQKSKKARKQNSKDAGKRLQRNAALLGIRERFNPFEVKQSARKDKFDVTSNKPVKKNGPDRPGVTKGLGEERRRATLLKEIQSRSKVGGILDRRFGENDPTMAPEQKAAERFARQSERKLKKSSIFNLEDEDEDEDEMQLTHGGRSLAFSPTDGHEKLLDVEVELSGEDEDDEDDDDDRPRKRLRLSDENDMQEENDNLEEALPEHRKSKQEVMKEVIAKSKLYKYERQRAKEDDDELRAELDRGLPEFYEALRNQRVPVKPIRLGAAAESDPVMNPDRAALLAGKDRADADKEYNERVRQMAMDLRSKPTDRTKTEEEKVTEEAEKLRDLEKKRLRRMRGETESSDDNEDAEQQLETEDEDRDDAQLFGLGQGHDKAPERRELDVEDEDEFILDENLGASDSEADMAADEDDGRSQGSSRAIESNEEDDTINGMVLPPGLSSRKDEKPINGIDGARASERDLAFTYPCPQTQEELLEIMRSTDIEDLPAIVQRIRTLHHPKLAAGNKAKLEQFSKVLTEHVAQLADEGDQFPSSVLETLLRHLHSLAKSFPETVGSAFRAHLQRISNEHPLKLSAGDLAMLTGVSAIFPTSDHFHSVVTPANLVLARYLGQSPVRNLGDLAIGSYCCTLALQYQQFSKRYVPECITYLVNAVSALAPTASKDPRVLVPRRLPDNSLRLTVDVSEQSGLLRVTDFQAGCDHEDLKVRLLRNFVALLGEATDLWQAKASFSEIFEPAIIVLEHLAKSCASRRLLQSNNPFLDQLASVTTTLQDRRAHSLDTRRPLLLHNHRPLAIKTSIPKFEESYNPDRHYDPDRERSELNKLKAEHKRERKGAMRELRKDANFIARESLREKKEKDAAYEKRFKRLVAEIQGEEGKEANEYEREKRKRKGKW